MSKKAKTSTSLVLASSVVTPLKGIEAVNAKLNSLQFINDTIYKTPGKVTLVTGTIDIKVEQNQDILVTCLASINARIQQKEAAYALLENTNYPVVKVDGGTLAEWVEDIKLRLKQLQYKDIYDGLTKLKSEFQKEMDKEDRLALLAQEAKEKFGVALDEI